MYAKELIQLLHELLGQPGRYDETLMRFESLRDYGLLPRGRENAGARLSNEQVVSAVLGFVPVVPVQAGLASLCLGDLRPVGGRAASFRSAATLNDSLARLMEAEGVCKSLLQVSLSVSSAPGGERYQAFLLLNENGHRNFVSFVHSMAVRLMSEGAEKDYDHLMPSFPVSRQLALGNDFFRKLGDKVALSRKLNLPVSTDWREYSSEEEKKDFYRRLGANRASSFLNVGVETQVTWPKEPVRLKFGGHHLVLFPKTKEYSHSISVDLVSEGITSDEARTLINRFLSILCWCDDQHAILREGWSGNPIPVPVMKRDLAFATAHHWVFDRSVPIDSDLLQRLAFYREGLNAREASLATFEALSFFKVFEVRVRENGTKLTKKWIAENFQHACQEHVDKLTLDSFDRDRASKSPEEYIYDNLRVAAAHTSENFPSDADSSLEVRRLFAGAKVIKGLARHFISSKFDFSTLPFSD